MKTVTREEVEKVFKEHSSAFVYEGAETTILNYLFGEPYEPKVGDWVVGWHNEGGELHYKAWQISRFNDEGLAVPIDRELWSTGTRNLRPATEEEIKRAQWKEGEVYEVWDNGRMSLIKRASDDYGYFWDNSKKKNSYEWDNFKRIEQC